MDFVLLLKAAIMGVVEGLTEFLPISSTGHLILTGHLLGLTDEKIKAFEIFIQMGAIMAIIWEYRNRLWQTTRGLFRDSVANRFALNVVLGCAPVILLAILIGKIIKSHLFSPIVVAGAFILGGLIILLVEKLMDQKALPSRVQHLDELSPVDAFKVGLVQCLGLIPGMSRSGSTIIGGLCLGLSRQVATQYSFFLGIPVLCGASLYALYKVRHELAWEDASFFATGWVFAFISAFFCVRWLLRFVSQHTFKGFAWYRIAFGFLILITHYANWVVWVE